MKRFQCRTILFDLDGVLVDSTQYLEQLRGKPSPDVYLKAAAGLGVAPADCLVIEDAPAGVEAARAAGMKVVALTTTHRIEELRAHACTASLAGRIAPRSHAAPLPKEQPDVVEQHIAVLPIGAVRLDSTGVPLTKALVGGVAGG